MPGSRWQSQVFWHVGMMHWEVLSVKLLAAAAVEAVSGISCSLDLVKKPFVLLSELQFVAQHGVSANWIIVIVTMMPSIDSFPPSAHLLGCISNIGLSVRATLQHVVPVNTNDDARQAWINMCNLNYVNRFIVVHSDVAWTVQLCQVRVSLLEKLCCWLSNWAFMNITFFLLEHWDHDFSASHRSDFRIIALM